jgi:hypothetical protein
MSSLLEIAINSIVNNVLNDIYTCMPAKILSYEGDKRRATVLPLIKRKFLDNVDLSNSPITNVPISFYGVGNCYIQLPDKEFKDQEVILLFSQRALDNWILNGKESTPVSFRKFDYNDAIAILSISNFSKKFNKSDDMTIKYKESKIVIKENGDIEIGSGIISNLLTSEYKTAVNLQLGLIATALQGLGVTITPFVEPLHSETTRVKGE